MSIGENIRLCRGAMKQAELAEKLGVTPTTISRWENNQNTPNGEMLQNIAEALDVNIDCLLKQSAEPKVKELNERSLKEDKGTMIYRFNDNEFLELPATEEFISMFERMVMERLKLKKV